jgi:hypothetical protein
MPPSGSLCGGPAAGGGPPAQRSQMPRGEPAVAAPDGSAVVERAGRGDGRPGDGEDRLAQRFLGRQISAAISRICSLKIPPGLASCSSRRRSDSNDSRRSPNKCGVELESEKMPATI